ncbi:hypothetical protein, partial [Mesorhizobium sp. B2-6-2]|uniref:hypothetical protein n=1 Tax=Mesorhizobium sp. B2-6-2 TaxID=2589915 RepID=UPI001AEEF5E5
RLGEGNGMDSRVFATELRSCAALHDEAGSGWLATIRLLFCWQIEHNVKQFIELYLTLQNIDIRSSAAP